IQESPSRTFQPACCCACLRYGSSFNGIFLSDSLVPSQIHSVTDTYVNWAMYLCGVKKIIVGGLAHQKIHDRECIALKDWIYFYEVLARFGLLHWVDKPQRSTICYEKPTSKLIQII